MKIYMAGNGVLLLLLRKYDGNPNKCPIYLLQTFYDMRKQSEANMRKILGSCKEFLLDSGAFTFMNSGVKIDWKQYIDEYIEFINKYDIEQFFELDLYTLPEIGIENTLKIREYIEHYTGKKSIPVFHACMGMTMYREMCQQYDYIGIGASGLTKECRWVKNTELLKRMVKIANGYNCKVHGLGYQRKQNLNDNKVGFYSVDATSWIGSRFNIKYILRNGILTAEKAVDTAKGERLVNYLELDEHNLKVFRKLQQLKEKE